MWEGCDRGLGWEQRAQGDEDTYFRVCSCRCVQHTQEQSGQRFSRRERVGSLGVVLGAETQSADPAGCPGRPGPHRYREFCSPSGSSLPPPPTPNVFPIGLETNMAAFVYFLIGMPASWIMSATAAAPGHSLHKQQLEKQNLGHCLGDFP